MSTSGTLLSPWPPTASALSLSGSTTYASAALGALRAGIVLIPLDPKLTASECEAILADTKPALLLDDAETVAAPPGITKAPLRVDGAGLLL